MSDEFSIGQLSKATGVKVPTIRYYEEINLLAAPPRSEGGQRRYSKRQREQLGFIVHAREMGFSIPAIRELLDLADHPERPCADADRIASERLAEVRLRLARLARLEDELVRMLDGHRSGKAGNCRILKILGDHGQCLADH